MFKLKAAQRLSADLEEHRTQDELDVEDFLGTSPTTAADTPRGRDKRDVVPYMYAQKLAAQLRAKFASFETPEDLHEGAMGDNTSETDPLHQMYENTNPRYLKGESTVNTPFDEFKSYTKDQDLHLEDQPDIVRGAKKHKPKPHTKPHLKKRAPTAHKPAHKKKKSLVDKLLEEDRVMYQNEASVLDSVSARSTIDFDSQPGSVHVRFPVSPGPTDGQSYLAADEESDMLGEPSEEGEIHILSSEVSEVEPEDETEVLSDADARRLWNIAQQPLS